MRTIENVLRLEMDAEIACKERGKNSNERARQVEERDRDNDGAAVNNQRVLKEKGQHSNLRCARNERQMFQVVARAKPERGHPDGCAVPCCKRVARISTVTVALYSNSGIALVAPHQEVPVKGNMAVVRPISEPYMQMPCRCLPVRCSKWECKPQLWLDRLFNITPARPFSSAEDHR